MGMDVKDEISEIAKHVDQESQQESKAMEELLKVLSEVGVEKESLEMFLQEKLNEILETEFTLQRETEKYREKSDQASQKNSESEGSLFEIKLEYQQKQDEKKQAEESFERLEKALIEVKREAERVSIEAANVPKLAQTKRMQYTISRLTLDKSAKEDQIKGFVVNELKSDVNPFSFNANEGVSSHFVTNYIWDLIAAGISKEWSKFL